MSEQDRLLDTSGGEAPAEWDELGRPIKYKTIVTLKKREQVNKNNSSYSNPNPKARAKDDSGPPKLFDISKLKLERFHQVLHYIVASVKDQEPSYKQPEVNADI